VQKQIKGGKKSTGKRRETSRENGKSHRILHEREVKKQTNEWKTTRGAKQIHQVKSTTNQRKGKNP